MNKEQLKAIATLTWMILSYVSAIVVAHGGHDFAANMTEASVLDVLTGISAIISTMYGWWSNNNMTKQAQAAQRVKDGMAGDTAVVSAGTSAISANTTAASADHAALSGGTTASTQPGQITATPEGK